MKLRKIVNLSIALPITLILLTVTLATFYYVNHMITDNAREKGLIVVQMAKTAILKSASEKKSMC